MHWKLLLFVCLISISFVRCSFPEQNNSDQPHSSATPCPKVELCYFSSTGHHLAPPFLDYYRRHDGPGRLGPPITEALYDEGWLVQYFQFGRLEYHPENDPDYHITVGWLGQHLHRQHSPQPEPSSTDASYAPATGHTVSGVFADFYHREGGSVQFGQPISPPFIVMGQLVQDFQSARFIWYPAAPPEAQVQLEPLGEIYFLHRNLPPGLLAPVPKTGNASLYQTTRVDFPANAAVKMFMETTPHPQVHRLRIQFGTTSHPLTGYVAEISLDGQRSPLPPTNRLGQTHRLLVLPPSTAERVIILYSHTGRILDQRTYSFEGSVD